MYSRCHYLSREEGIDMTNTFYLQYYFGDYNLVKDEFLQKAMEKNDGCILEICVMIENFSERIKTILVFPP